MFLLISGVLYSVDKSSASTVIMQPICQLFGILFKMYKNIKEKDWRGAVYYFVGFAIGTPYFYLYFTRTHDVRKAFTEIITYFS